LSGSLRMSGKAAELLKEALALPLEERAELEKRGRDDPHPLLISMSEARVRCARQFQSR